MLKIDIEYRIGTFELTARLNISAGITVIEGGSGSGKSSLLGCISGLLKPRLGKIQLDENVFFDSNSGTNVPPQRRSCGYVLQSLALFPHLNVAQNICFGIERLAPDIKEKRLNDLLATIKMEGSGLRKISELSGGQLQRVALARALAPSPKLLLLDEPFSALDLDLRSELGEQLKELQRQLRIPVLMVTHLRSEAILLADHFVSIKDGLAEHNLDIKSASAVKLDAGSQLSW